jgi:hypothetical protein
MSQQSQQSQQSYELAEHEDFDMPSVNDIPELTFEGL